MALCYIQGRPEMYGLGIRIAFYLQWAGVTLLTYLDERSLPDIRLLGLLLSGAMTLSLVIQVANDHLQPADIYISLLLAAGIFIFLVPIYVWRALTLCNPYWNPLRWIRENQIPAVRFAHFGLIVAVASVATWYYTTFLPNWNNDCEQYGFFFTKVSLHNTPYIAFNAILYILMIVVSAGILLQKIGFEVYIWTKEKRRKRIRQHHVDALHAMRNFFNVAVVAVLIAAVELTIQWNELDGINNIDTAAQTIPLIIAAGIVVRVLFLLYVNIEEDSSSDEGEHTRVRVSVHETRRETTEIPPPPPVHPV